MALLSCIGAPVVNFSIKKLLCLTSEAEADALLRSSSPPSPGAERLSEQRAARSDAAYVICFPLNNESVSFGLQRA